jgi:autotransporter-associated beta strand protein
VANVSGGTWSSSGNLRIGQEATGTLNLTGGNVVVASGTGNVTIGQETGSSGTLNIGTGTTVGTLQAARVTGGNGTAVVNFNHSGNETFSPILAGSLAVNKLGSGTTTLSGNNTYTGATAINAGELLVNGNLASSATTVNSGGTLGGIGTLGAVTINSGGTIAPGNSPGTISVGNMTWNAGGNYNWQLANATASAGSGWDLISSTGTLTITANATNKFTINLWSLSGTGPDVSGIAANFDAQSNYSWNIGTFSNINGFDASYFDIVTAASNGTDGFVGGNGTFSVNSTTTTLVLNYAAAPTPIPTPILMIATTIRTETMVTTTTFCRSKRNRKSWRIGDRIRPSVYFDKTLSTLTMLLTLHRRCTSTTTGTRAQSLLLVKNCQKKTAQKKNL